MTTKRYERRVVTSVSIEADLLAEAKAKGIYLSEVLGEALKAKLDLKNANFELESLQSRAAELEKQKAELELKLLTTQAINERDLKLKEAAAEKEKRDLKWFDALQRAGRELRAEKIDYTQDELEVRIEKILKGG